MMGNATWIDFKRSFIYWINKYNNILWNLILTDDYIPKADWLIVNNSSFTYFKNMYLCYEQAIWSQFDSLHRACIKCSSLSLIRTPGDC